MIDTPEDESTGSSGGHHHDPLMNLFLAGIALLLIGCAILMVVANNRPPAGL
ncbi:MAG: hypothetical protein IT336_02480 [Thermomicrobiales bacterium]|nr:hypothetical protein [Thermomicrobiales bacterium]